MAEVPILRVELESMRVSILTALTDRNEQISKMVSESIDRLDIGKIVEATVNSEAPRIVEAAIESAIRQSIDWEFRKALVARIGPAVMAAIEDRLPSGVEKRK